MYFSLGKSTFGKKSKRSDGNDSFSLEIDGYVFFIFSLSDFVTRNITTKSD